MNLNDLIAGASFLNSRRTLSDALVEGADMPDIPNFNYIVMKPNSDTSYLDVRRLLLEELICPKGIEEVLRRAPHTDNDDGSMIPFILIETTGDTIIKFEELTPQWTPVGIPYSSVYSDSGLIIGFCIVYIGVLFLIVRSNYITNSSLQIQPSISDNAVRRAGTLTIKRLNLALNIYETYGEGRISPSPATPYNQPKGLVSLREVSLNRLDTAIAEFDVAIKAAHTSLLSLMADRDAKHKDRLRLESQEYKEDKVVITHPDVVSYSIIAGKLVFETDYLVSDVEVVDDEGEYLHTTTAYLGRFIVTVQLYGALTGKEAVEIINISRNEVGMDGYGTLVPSPHTVYTKRMFHSRSTLRAYSCTVNPCLGSYEGVVIDLIESNNYESLVDHLILYLKGVNTEDIAGDKALPQFNSFREMCRAGWDTYTTGFGSTVVRQDVKPVNLSDEVVDDAEEAMDTESFLEEVVIDDEQSTGD